MLKESTRQHLEIYYWGLLNGEKQNWMLFLKM